MTNAPLLAHHQHIVLGRTTPTRQLQPLKPKLRNYIEGEDGYAARWKHLWFIASESMEEDGRWWIHVSVSRTDRKLPTYDDLMLIKRIAIGEDRWAFQVHPPKDKHIDIAGRKERPVQVLHLWSPEENPLPDFARGGNSI